MVLATSKLSDDFKTTIPKEIIKKCNIDKDYIIEWDLTDDGEPLNRLREALRRRLKLTKTVRMKFRPQRVCFK